MIDVRDFGIYRALQIAGCRVLQAFALLALEKQATTTGDSLSGEVSALPKSIMAKLGWVCSTQTMIGRRVGGYQL